MMWNSLRFCESLVSHFQGFAMKKIWSPTLSNLCHPSYRVTKCFFSFASISSPTVEYPVFLHVFLCYSHLSASFSRYPNICQLDADGFPNPSNAFHLYPEDLHSQDGGFVIGGGLFILCLVWSSVCVCVCLCLCVQKTSFHVRLIGARPPVAEYVHMGAKLDIFSIGWFNHHLAQKFWVISHEPRRWWSVAFLT